MDIQFDNDTQALPGVNNPSLPGTNGVQFGSASPQNDLPFGASAFLPGANGVFSGSTPNDLPSSNWGAYNPTAQQNDVQYFDSAASYRAPTGNAGQENQTLEQWAGLGTPKRGGYFDEFGEWVAG
jgi:hypothetical protein